MQLLAALRGAGRELSSFLVELLALLAQLAFIFFLSLFEQFLGFSLLLEVVSLGLVEQSLQLLLVADEKLNG